MKRASSALVIAALAAACDPPRQAPGTARFVELAADPPPAGTYRHSLVPTPAVARCAAEYAVQREARYERRASECLLAASDESALPDLLVLGVTNERKPGSEITAFEDSVDAAVFAGRIAAVTSPRELVVMLSDPNPSTEGFALAALTSMLKTQAKTGSLAASAPAIASACAPLVASPDDRVAITAAECAVAAKQDSAGPALARVYVANPSAAVKAAAATALATLPSAALDDATLHGIADFLRTPIASTWYIADVRAREMACLVLAQHVQRAPWAIEAAGVAAEAMHNRGGSNGQNYPPSCATYAKVE